jgi:hypothetical protein
VSNWVAWLCKLIERGAKRVYVENRHASQRDFAA